MDGPPTAVPPEAAATGLLSEKPLPHLLAYVRDRKLSGTFVIADEPRQRAKIVVAQGKLARTWTSEPVIYLGHVLYEDGVIDGGQLSATLAEVASKKALHGEILLAKGLINVAQLAKALHQQRARKLHHIFGLPLSSSFAFFADVDLIGERPNDVEPVDMLAMIWRGIAARPSWEHVRETLSKIGDCPVRVIAPIDTSMFRSAEGAAVSAMRHARSTVAELARLVANPQAAELLVYFLVVNRLAVVENLDAPPPLERPPSRPKVAVPEREAYVRRVSFTMRAVSVHEAPNEPPPSVRPLARPRTDPTSIDVAAAASFAQDTHPEAESAVRQAEMLFVLGERSDALRVVRAALTIAPRMATGLVLLLAIEAAEVSDPEKLRDILRRLDTVLASNRTCRRGRFRRGQIRKRLGDLDGAIDDFRAAMAADPNDVEAREELKSCDRRGREAPPHTLMDRLRGK
jgi:tetratricopeptide (TPR) repeat protein